MNTKIPSRIDLPPLTGLRGVAALGVMLVHLYGEINHAFRVGPDFRGSGQIYVDVFFVLSGFILCHVYLNSETLTFASTWKKFYIARFARLYPLHAAGILFIGSFAVAASLLGVKLDEKFNLLGLIKDLLFFQAFFTSPMYDPWVFTSWSISVEWWLYVFIFPLVILGLKFKRLFFLVSISITIYLLFYLYNLPEGARYTKGIPAFLRGVTEFVLGAGAWLSISRTGFQAACAKIGPALLLMLPVADIYSTGVFGGPPWFFIIFLPFLVGGFALGGTWAHRFLSSRIIMWLGLISYSLYLMHPIVFTFMKFVWKRGFMPNPVVYGLLNVICVFLVSALTFYFIEMPARKWIKGYFDRAGWV